MSSFAVRLFQHTSKEVLQNVILFVGEDSSGSFGIQSGHAPFMTLLSVGLVRIEYQDESTDYLALPGGLLHMRDHVLSLHTRRYWRGADYSQMNNILKDSVRAEVESQRHVKTNLEQIEDVMLRRLMDLERIT